MGAAFAEGIASYLIGHRYRVEEIVHINPFQAADITTNADPNVKTLDYQNTDDIVINQIPLVSSPGDIRNADHRIREKSNETYSSFCRMESSLTTDIHWCSHQFKRFRDISTFEIVL